MRDRKRVDHKGIDSRDNYTGDDHGDSQFYASRKRRCDLCREASAALLPQLNTGLYYQAFYLFFGGSANDTIKSLQELIFTPDYMCGKILGFCTPESGYPAYKEVSDEEAVYRILRSKPFSLADNDFIDSLYYKMKVSTKARKTLKFVHLADTHADMEYQEGAVADCGGSYCCRNDTFKGRGTKPAG